MSFHPTVRMYRFVLFTCLAMLIVNAAGAANMHNPGATLSCYECDSTLNKACLDPFEKDGQNVTACPTICVKSKTDNDGTITIIRACVKTCKEVDTTENKVHLIIKCCTGDKCNNGVRTFVSVGTVTSMLILWMFL